MRKARMGLAMAGVALVALSACGGGNRTPHLMNLHSTTDGPDEFAILPPKALTMPPDLTVLPEPTPGSANLTDPRPMDDAIVALGGKAPTASGIPAGDRGLVAYASRNGVAPDIRSSLAAEDLEWRRKHPGFVISRLFGLNSYFTAYEGMWLNGYSELAKWRAAGVQTPSAPPRYTGKKR